MHSIPRVLAAVVLAAILTAAGVGRGFDAACHDVFARINLALANRPEDPAPVIVAVDGKTLRQYGRWPWPRALLAELLAAVNAGSPTVTALDILLADPAPGDSQLVGVISDSSPVVAERIGLFRRPGGGFRTSGGDPPAPAFAEITIQGFIDFFPDYDGITRRMPTRVRVGGEEQLSLAASLARAAGVLPAGGTPREIVLRYALSPSEWPVVSAGEILDGRADPAVWRGRPVLIGLTAPGVADMYPVAVRAFGSLPGVYLHAYTYAALSERKWTCDLPRPWAAGLLLLITTPFAMPGMAARPWRILTGAAVALLVVLAGSCGLYLACLWWRPFLPFTAAAMAAVFQVTAHAAAGYRRERRLKDTFARFVSAAALKEILAGPEPALGGEEREITVIFADLRGFSAFAEDRPPEEVAAALSKHLDLMCRTILDNGGMVDKFLGDAVMGIFGAPIPDAEHSRHALAAAEAIIRALNPPDFLAPAVGMAAGRAVVGAIGGRDRLEYTAIGDPVNLAARLEEMAGPKEILAAAGCFSLGGPGEGWNSLGLIEIRGRRGKVEVYRMVMRVTDAVES